MHCRDFGFQTRHAMLTIFDVAKTAVCLAKFEPLGISGDDLAIQHDRFGLSLVQELRDGRERVSHPPSRAA
jgi:hypothetical protein